MQVTIAKPRIDGALAQKKQNLAEYSVVKYTRKGIFYLSGLSLMTMDGALNFRKAQTHPNDWRLIHVSEMPERERQLSESGDISKPCATYPYQT